MKFSIERTPSPQRYCVAIAILLIPIVLSIVRGLYHDGSRSMIPTDWPSLGDRIGEAFFIWGGTFALAYRVSAIPSTALMLGEIKGFKTFRSGVLWSILLRISLIPFIFLIAKITGPEFLQASALKIIGVLNFHAFEGQTGKALLFFAIISVLAGVLEELWRAGIFAGLRGLYPNAFEKTSQKFLMIVLVSGLFGIAHLYQGWAGVILAFFMGIGLGAVQLFRKSYWEAAVAHTLFDFASFSLAFLLLAQIIPSQLFSAVKQGEISNVKTLIKVGGDVNARYKKGYTPLATAIFYQHPQVVQFLLEKGADPNLPIEGECTVAMIAAEKGNLEIFELLVKHGADLELKDEKGRTALDFAKKHDRKEIVDFLSDIKKREGRGSEASVLDGSR